MMHKYARFLSFFLLFLMVGDAQGEEKDYDIIGQRLYHNNLVSYPDSLVTKAIEQQKEDGSFMDIDYDSRDGNVWPSREHYYRLYYYAFAYANPINKRYLDGELYEGIVKGLSYWYDRNPTSTNWWFQTIEIPEMIGKILLCLKYGNPAVGIPSDISEKSYDYYNSIKVDPYKYDGANRVKIAMHWVYYGVLMSNTPILSHGLKCILDDIKYSNTLDGFKVDNSFLSTGKIYIGAYGEQMLESILQATSCIEGTEFSLDKEKLDLLRSYFLESYANLVRGQSMMYNCMGRSMTYKGFLKNVPKRVSYAERMKLTDPQHADEYDLVSRRFKGEIDASEMTQESHHHYFCADFTRHNRRKYNFSVSVVSERSCRSEWGNGEAQCTYYVSDGSTCLVGSGEEYTDIMPLWDWRKVPGTTVPRLDTIPVGKSWTVHGYTPFAGGVSDSIYGCTAYKYYDDHNGVNTGACKGYFFFDDEVVCLGAGINSTHPDVYTSIEQNWGGQNFIVKTDRGREDFYGVIPEKDLKGTEWVLHNNIGYIFPDKADVTIRNDINKGNWHNIAITQEDKDIEGKVFSLLFNHKKVGAGFDNYAYILLPEVNEEQIEAYQKKVNVEIVANTDSVQAVRHRGLGLSEYIFYKACSVDMGEFVVKTNKPCLLMVRESSNGYYIHVADPVQQSENIVVELKGSYGSSLIEADYTDVDIERAGETQAFYVSNSITSINDCEEMSDDKCEHHGTYNLYNMNGQIVASGVINGKVQDIDIPKNGMYIISLMAEQRKYLYKIISR